MTSVRAARSDEPPTKFETGRAKRLAKKFNAMYTRLLFLVVTYTGPGVKEHSCIMFGARAPNQDCLKPGTNVVWLVED